MVEILVLNRPLHRTVGDIVFFPNLITCAKILVHYKCLQHALLISCSLAFKLESRMITDSCTYMKLIITKCPFFQISGP